MSCKKRRFFTLDLKTQADKHISISMKSPRRASGSLDSVNAVGWHSMTTLLFPPVENGNKDVLFKEELRY